MNNHQHLDGELRRQIARILEIGQCWAQITTDFSAMSKVVSNLWKQFKAVDV